jgi:hypothetical protein
VGRCRLLLPEQHSCRRHPGCAALRHADAAACVVVHGCRRVARGCQGCL